MRRLIGISVLLTFISIGLAHVLGENSTTQPGFATATTQPPAGAAASEDGITVYFSPHGGCTEAIVREIDQAKDSILVQAYAFTSAPIAKAITDALKRGVKVTAILDASNRPAQYSAATFLFNAGVSVFIDANHAIAHNKIILIDGHTIITGSFNFSKEAEESNAENLLIIKDKLTLFDAYEQNFANHLTHSTTYTGPVVTEPEAVRGPPAVKPEPPATPSPRIASPPQPRQPQPTITVYVTRTGSKYHSAGCSYLRRSAIPMDLKDAKAQGYTPCSRCAPPS
ncbi:phospholipase D family protein [Fontivita pretiosa]|uniref:phospholipase D family nuclease n=1 Tax=Fontivita pretiosa TaxID=2989684 RepID=UPI003D17831B